MSGTLFVVATPIGNLEDVTLRALRVLQTVDLIAAEDTRRTARLLSHHGISTPTLSFHQHNTRSRVPQLISRLQRGDSIAVVTDAGTPGVSDPGVELIHASIEAGIPVDPIPGASAPIAAAIASGFPLIPLTVYGFVPSRSKDRSSWLSAVSGIPNTFTFFETPHRIRQTLTAAISVFGDRPIVVCRELTKAHQEILRGTAARIQNALGEPRGEYTVVVGPVEDRAESTTTQPDAVIVADFCYSTEIEGLTRRAAISSVAKKHRISSKAVYQIIENNKHSPDHQ